MRVVFDTNVVVALLVFRDRELMSLARRWEGGDIETVANAATLGEFDRVLRYPELKLADGAACAASDAYRARCTLMPDVAGDPSLPRCADPDDQMFLQLAQAAQAEWLLTRDNALLELQHRVRFRIARPEQLGENDVDQTARGSDPAANLSLQPTRSADQTTRNGNRSLSDSASTSGS